MPILFGSDQVNRSGNVVRLYNAAFLVTPEGETAAVYRKIHLVPFGEYIPFKNLLYFVSPLVERLADFAPGTSMVMLPVGSHQVNTAICYEVVYPSLIRAGGPRRQRAVDDDHQRRVVRVLVRAVSALRDGVDARHRTGPVSRARRQHRHQRHRRSVWTSGARSTIFEQVGLVGEARVLTGRTMYSRIGDQVAYVAIALTAMGAGGDKTETVTSTDLRIDEFTNCNRRSAIRRFVQRQSVNP